MQTGRRACAERKESADPWSDVSDHVLGGGFLRPTPLRPGHLAAKLGPISLIRTLYIKWVQILPKLQKSCPGGSRPKLGSLFAHLKFVKVRRITYYQNIRQPCLIMQFQNELNAFKNAQKVKEYVAPLRSSAPTHGFDCSLINLTKVEMSQSPLWSSPSQSLCLNGK